MVVPAARQRYTLSTDGRHILKTAGRAALVLAVVAAVVYVGVTGSVLALAVWLVILGILIAMVWAAVRLIRGR